MEREDSKRYKEYCALKIPHETEAEWLRAELDARLDALVNGRERKAEVYERLARWRERLQL